MRLAWGFGIISLILAGGCRMTSEETEVPVREELTVPEKETPEKEVPLQEPPADRFSRNQLLEFHIPGDRSTGQKGVELWYNSDGVNWYRKGFFEASKKKADFYAPVDGRYEVVFVPLDFSGVPAYTPSRETRPDYTVIVDTRTPQVILLKPNGGEKFGSGKTVLINWKAVDPHLHSEGVRIEVKPLNGQWSTIGKNLPNTESFVWDTPRSSDARYLIRVSVTDRAGNTGFDESDNSFEVDGLAPVARVVGPSQSGSSPVEIEYEVNDLGGAGIKEVRLYFTRDGGETWEFYGTDDDGKSPLVFQELDDEYGFHVMAIDRVGNQGAIPQSGTKPQYEMIVDSTSPRMEFTSPRESAFLFGRAIEVRWALRDNVGLAENPIRLDYSDDGGKTWNLIREKISKEPPFLWGPAKKAGNSYQLQATVHDLVGNKTQVRSDIFAIDLAVPEARVTGKARSRKNLTAVEYEIINRGYSPLKNVVLWFSPDSGDHWYRWGEDPDRVSPMIFSKNDGYYTLYVTCQSKAGARAGRVQKPPMDGTLPDYSFQIQIDSTPPVLELKEVPSRPPFAAGGSVPIRWKGGLPAELHPDPTGLDIHYSTTGKKWNLIAEKLDPSTGRYNWTLPPDMNEPMVHLRLTVKDQFGNQGVIQSELPFEVDGTSPEVGGKFSIDREVRSLPKTVTAAYYAEDAQSGLQTVQMWGKLDNGEVELLSETASPKGRLSTEITQKGKWKFWLVAMDRAGNKNLDLKRNPNAEPDFERAIGYPESKELELLSFSGGGRPYRGGATLLIAVRTNIPLESIRGKVSADSGKNWKEIPSQNLESVRGGLLWHGLPEKTGQHYRLLLYNHAKEVRSDQDFSIDATPPKAVVFGPKGHVEKKTVVLDTRVKPSISLIVSRTLWFTRDGGKTWSIFQIYRNPGDEIVFTSQEKGLHGFTMTATSRVGLSEPNPLSGSMPQHSIQMGGEKPVSLSGKVTITTIPPSILGGGSREKISWTAVSNDPKAKVALYLHFDGSQIAIKEGLDLSGEYEWVVPEESATRCELRASVMVGGVPQWGKPTAVFTIDGSPPRVLGSDIVEE